MGFTGNAAIGVGWQNVLVVVVFISSLYTGMGVLVARLPCATTGTNVDVFCMLSSFVVLLIGTGKARHQHPMPV